MIRFLQQGDCNAEWIDAVPACCWGKVNSVARNAEICVDNTFLEAMGSELAV